jgi:hypothetical protein
MCRLSAIPCWQLAFHACLVMKVDGVGAGFELVTREIHKNVIQIRVGIMHAGFMPWNIFLRPDGVPPSDRCKIIFRILPKQSFSQKKKLS